MWNERQCTARKANSFVTSVNNLTNKVHSQSPSSFLNCLSHELYVAEYFYSASICKIDAITRCLCTNHTVINGWLIWSLYGGAEAIVGVDECQATRVIHFLQYPGCVPKPIPSYACRGRCSSYLQVSGSKMWQMERSCMCCQESGEREASVSLFCPRAKPGEKKFRKVITKAPLECMCRPCTSVEEYAIIPQEIAGFADEGPFATTAHFRRSSGLQ
ncbi:bursicon [Cardiocondyla obscurior]